MVFLARTIWPLLLLTAISCRTTPDNPPEPVEPTAFIDLTVPDEGIAELEVEVQDTIDIGEDGTINIQGMHINNQAYGPNRIKGGSVKIN